MCLPYSCMVLSRAAENMYQGLLLMTCTRLQGVWV